MDSYSCQIWTASPQSPGVSHLELASEIRFANATAARRPIPVRVRPRTVQKLDLLGNTSLCSAN